MKRKIKKMFLRGNVVVVGEKGCGKDLLIGNVYKRIKRSYVSNQNYGGQFYEDLDLTKLDMGGNTYKDLIDGTFTFYEYPYSKGTDIIISDGGIYLPAQYCNELNRDYKGLPMFMALSRQIGRANVHVNTQAYSRLWDKAREQAFRYISCEWCIYLFGFVIQRVIVYNKADSCQARVKPCRVPIPKMGDKNARMQARIYRDQFYNQHGEVVSYLLIYRNKSKHDTYQFERIFKNAPSRKKEEKQKSKNC